MIAELRTRLGETNKSVKKVQEMTNALAEDMRDMR